MSHSLIQNGQSIMKPDLIVKSSILSAKKTGFLAKLNQKLNPSMPPIEEKPDKNESFTKSKTGANLNETSTSTHISKANSNERIDIIREANKILKERNKNSGANLASRAKSKLDNIVDCREICLKNYLIDLLKGERTVINDKELSITKALKESESRLDRDYRLFMDYMEGEKKRQKASEQEYLDILGKNKKRTEKEKWLLQENKQIVDDVERTVKMILNLKSYALFVHNVLGESFFAKLGLDGGASSENIFSDSNTRENSLEKLSEKLIFSFSKTDLSSNYEPEFLIDTSLLTGKFVEIEDNILKLMEKKHNIDKELKLMEEQNRSELEELRQREITVREEKYKLVIEKDRDVKILHHLHLQTNDEGYNKNILNFINELYLETTESSHDESKKIVNKKKTDNNYIKDLIELLRFKENLIINYISEIEKIKNEDENLFKNLIAKRKERNKEAKLLIQKKKKDYCNLISFLIF